jgi:hypothetical protein
MIQHLGQDAHDRHIFVVQFALGCLEELPWGSEPFDCTVFAFDVNLLRQLSASICSFLVEANTGWINTTGWEARWLHDEIDTASVRHGRQYAVGDGSPMTAWFDDAMDAQAMADIALSMGEGHEHVLALIVGTEADLDTAAAAIRAHLTKPGWREQE